MKVKRIVVGAYCVNCYIVYNDKNEGFIVDPGAEFEEINKFILDNKINLNFIILTHGHGDHIGAVLKLKEKYKLPIYSCIYEKDLLSNSVINLSQSIPPFKAISFEADKYVKDGDLIDFFGHQIKIIETPGHTIGSICFYVDEYLFTGDTLFNMTIGRSDLATGSHEKIINSLNKLYLLDKDYIVLPGHGAQSTLYYEKKNNPFMKNIKSN